MIIKMRPQNRPEYVVFEKRGESIIVDGEEFDFSRIQEGDILPREAINSTWFGYPGDVTRTNGEIVLTIMSPFGPDYDYDQPDVRMLGDGIIPLAQPREEPETLPPVIEPDVLWAPEEGDEQ